MACSKYILTNTGTTIVTFNYQRCDDALWQYQVELLPSETKNIWLLDNTYSTAFSNFIVLTNLGAFPFTSPTPTPSITASPTPTPSTTSPVTPTPTPTTTPPGSPTATQTPTITPTTTQTPSPTNVVRTGLSITGHSESSAIDACESGTSTLFVNGTSMANSTLAWADAFGPNTGNPTGYYNEDGIIYYVNGSCGIGCSSGATITLYGVCASPTPTVTPTNTATPTQTPTPSITPSSTPTNIFSVYSGSTYEESCGQYFSPIVVYGNNIQFDLSSQFSDTSTFPPSIDMSGYIQNGGTVFELDSNGSVVGFATLCTTLTPTPTNSSTPTQTPTTTPSPTPTFGYYTYSLGTGATANDACIDFSGAPNTIYGTVAGGPGPNINEFLYTTPGNPPTNPVADGFYSNGTAVFQVSGGLGQITAVDPSGC